jgi:uncharacterized membrane protein
MAPAAKSISVGAQQPMTSSREQDSPKPAVHRTNPRRKEWLVVCLLAGLWSLVVGWLAISRHLAFNTGYDLGTFTQVVWATAQGRPFYSSLTAGMTSFLGLHFSPLLALLAPLYSVWPDARILLLAQTVILSAGAVPLYGFARARIGRHLALLVVIVLLLSPLVLSISQFEFHAIAFAVPLLMAAGAALLDERPTATLIWLGLALMAKEEVAFIAVGFGLYALLIQRRARFGAALTVGAIAWTVVLFNWLMPAFGQNPDGYAFSYRYETLGGAPGQVIQTLFTKPATVLRVVATRPKATFLLQLLAPLAGLPLLGIPAVLLTLPTLAYLLLSDYGLMVSIRFHYTAPLIPFLLLATVTALQRLRTRDLRLARFAGVALLAATLIGTWWWSPLPGGRASESGNAVGTDEAQAARALIARVPTQAAVASDWAYLPWLANRWLLDTVLAPPYPELAPTMPPEYLVSRVPVANSAISPLYPWTLRDPVVGPLYAPRYLPIETTPGGLVLSEWRGAEHDVELGRLDAPFERGLVLLAAGLPPGGPKWGPVIQVETGTVLPVWLAWTAHLALDQRITFTLHLVDDTGEHVAQVDQEMGGGRFPTTLWHVWMDAPTLVDEFQLPIVAELPPGRYRLFAGAYESDSVTPLLQPDQDAWFELATIDVLGPPE